MVWIQQRGGLDWEDAIFLLLSFFVPVASTLGGAGVGWAFAAEDDAFSSEAALDVGAMLNESNAGEAGFVRLSDDKNFFIRGDCTPIPFWGVVSEGWKMSPEDMERHPKWLAKRGVNIVRVHANLPVNKEGAAVFFDFAAACDYVPNVTQSKIATVVAPNIQEVDYSIDVPILPDEHYSVRNRLTALGDDSYRVDWKLLRALQTKDSVGEFLVEPCEGKTIVRYRNLTTPASSMAVLLRGKAIEQIRATADAICNEATRLKQSDESALSRKVEKLKAAVGWGSIDNRRYGIQEVARESREITRKGRSLRLFRKGEFVREVFVLGIESRARDHTQSVGFAGLQHLVMNSPGDHTQLIRSQFHVCALPGRGIMQLENQCAIEHKVNFVKAKMIMRRGDTNPHRQGNIRAVFPSA